MASSGSCDLTFKYSMIKKEELSYMLVIKVFMIQNDKKTKALSVLMFKK